MKASSKILGYFGILVLLLSGCSASESSETVAGPSTKSEEIVTPESTTEPDDSYAGTWLMTNPVSSQKILEDLTYVGFCEEWGDAPSPDSQFGQIYARDLYRQCSTGMLPDTTPDCSAYIVVGTGDQVIEVPTEMNYGDSSAIAIFSNPDFSITFMTGGEYDGSIMVHRCYGALQAMSQVLGDSVEVQLNDNKSLTAGLDKKVDFRDYWAGSEDYFGIGERVYVRYAEERVEGLTCSDGFDRCAPFDIVTAGWCQDLVFAYDLLAEGDEIVGSKVYTTSSSASYEPFPILLGADPTDPDHKTLSWPEATCNAWWD